MGIETDFARLIDRAPKVTCPRCNVDMLRNAVAADVRPKTLRTWLREGGGIAGRA